MNIDLIAQIRTFKEFMDLYQPGDEKKFYGGVSLICFALANTKPSERYAISTFLLDRGVDVRELDVEGHSTLQILLDGAEHKIEETCELCARLIELGADINHRDKKYGQVAIQYIARLGEREEKLQGIYDLWFSQPNLDLEGVDRAGNNPIEYARIFNDGGRREEMIRRMEEYEQRQQAGRIH